MQTWARCLMCEWLIWNQSTERNSHVSSPLLTKTNPHPSSISCCLSLAWNFSSSCGSPSLSACLHRALTSQPSEHWDLRMFSLDLYFVNFVTWFVSYPTLFSPGEKAEAVILFCASFSNICDTGERKEISFSCPLLFHTVLSGSKRCREGMRPLWGWINMFCLQCLSLSLFFFFPSWEYSCCISENNVACHHYLSAKDHHCCLRLPQGNFSHSFLW